MSSHADPRRGYTAVLRAASISALALLLAGCAGTAGAPAADAPAPATPTERPVAASTPFPVPSPVASARPAAEATATPLAPEAPEEPSAPSRCIDEQLTLAVEPLPDESGAGQSAFNLRFSNVSTASCTVWGWPGVSAVGSDGALIGFPAQAFGNDGELVTLQPGGVALSHVRLGAAGAYGCPAVTAFGIRAFVTSDGAGPGVTAEHAIVVCADATSTMQQGAFAAAG